MWPLFLKNVRARWAEWRERRAERKRGRAFDLLGRTKALERRPT